MESNVSSLWSSARRWWWTERCTSPDSWGWTWPRVSWWKEECRHRPSRWRSFLVTQLTQNILNSHGNKQMCEMNPSHPFPPQALINMGEILKAAGCDYTNGETPELPTRSCCSGVWRGKLTNVNSCFSVVKTTVLLADINDFNSVNEVYKTCKALLFASHGFTFMLK